jgi:alcohol dehydrogenase (cytochrome c)
MIRRQFFVAALICGVIAPAPTASAQVRNFTPVTQEMLLNPSPNDWLMYSRTYDSQRFSPLNQITRQNVGQLRMVWTRGMYPGIHENIPLVHQGVFYVANPGAVLQALDATNGDLLWEYKRKLPDDLGKYVNNAGRARTLALYEDFLYFAAPDGYVVALDARTGALRWETKAHDYKTGAQHTTGPVVVQGKVITGRSCPNPETTRSGCFVVAHDGRTGKELWKVYTTAAPGDPGGDTWGGLPVEERMASPWGLPGSYDPVRKLVYWGVANPRPHTRMKRHHGDPDAIPRSAPSELYSNSTIALDPDTGKLAWYYQHLPGDDWDSDFTHDRVLLRTPFNPDPSAVKWINPRIPRGQERDVMVNVGEPGGLFVLDRATGEFLWAMPFPFDTPNFILSKIDVETGKTYINWDQVIKKDGQKILVCYSNTRGYWPMTYYPSKNSLYVPYLDDCAEKTGNMDSVNGAIAKAAARPGSDPNAYFGIAKVNMATGRIQRFYTSRIGGNGAMLATAGDLIFWGDLNRRFRAFDADSGKILWETILGGIIQNSTITYSVNGKQYVAVLTGDGVSHTSGPLAQIPDIKPPRGYNAIYVFALP